MARPKVAHSVALKVGARVSLLVVVWVENSDVLMVGVWALRTVAE